MSLETVSTLTSIQARLDEIEEKRAEVDQEIAALPVATSVRRLIDRGQRIDSSHLNEMLARGLENRARFADELARKYPTADERKLLLASPKFAGLRARSQEIIETLVAELDARDNPQLEAPDMNGKHNPEGDDDD